MSMTKYIAYLCYKDSMDEYTLGVYSSMERAINAIRGACRPTTGLQSAIPNSLFYGMVREAATTRDVVRVDGIFGAHGGGRVSNWRKRTGVARWLDTVARATWEQFRAEREATLAEEKLENERREGGDRYTIMYRSPGGEFVRHSYEPATMAEACGVGRELVRDRVAVSYAVARSTSASFVGR